MADFTFPGATGSYEYWWLSSLEPLAIKAEPGNYGFLKPAGDNRWLPIYWGQTDNLRNRLPNHEKLAAARQLGATRFVAHTNLDEKSRLAEEADLIRKWRPALNVQQPDVTGTKR